MPNKRSPNKEGVAISVEKSLKAKWQKEAAEMGLTLTDYIILKCEQNYERANNHTKQNNAKSKRDGNKWHISKEKAFIRLMGYNNLAQKK